MKQVNNKYQQGFTLVEIFIALAIGLVLIGGILSVFVGMRATTSETSSYGELQENGRFAINLISDDLLRQGFWGDYTGTINLASINPVPAAPAGECVGDGANNGTFPLAPGNFRTIWGETATASSIVGKCWDDAKVGSDILQLKRVTATLTGLVAGDAVPAGNYYFMSNMNNGTIFSGGTVPDIKNGRVWEYQHHIYYVSEQTSNNLTVPVLMQGRLSNTLAFQPIIDGIERIHFEYGVDRNLDGIVNAYIPADNMTEALWDNTTTRVISVKIYVLARDILKDNKYENKNTYKLGDSEYTVNDNYRRLLFSSTVNLYNANIDTWN